MSFIHRFVTKLLIRRHFWRYVGFSELAEVYVSQAIHSMAMNMVGIFIAIYLYQAGYSILFILVFFAAYQLARVIFMSVTAYVVARFGPKHAILLSNITYVAGFLSLIKEPEYGLWAVIAYGLFAAVAKNLYQIGFNVNFSKVKHADHVGKEIGQLYIFEKVFTSLAPAIAGLLAFMFGAQVIMAVAVALFVLASMPLFMTPETIKLRDRPNLKFFKWHNWKRNLVASGATGLDSHISATNWPLFMAIAVFGAGTTAIYAQLGLLGSATIIIAILAAYFFGKVADNDKGGELLNGTVIGNSIVHLFRPFVATPVGAILANFSNELFTTGQRLAYSKGVYSVSDSSAERRVAHLMFTEMAVCIGAMIASAITALLVWLSGDILGLQLSFVLAAFLILPIMNHGFKVLEPSSLVRRAHK